MMQEIEKDQSASERVKGLIELAIQCGRRLQSPQTGYVHYYYQSQEEEVQQTIPLLENLLFTLALLRSKTIENITEAKEMLEHLLIFQNTQATSSHGNFPVYLHEYPNCRDQLLSVHLLAPLYWIAKGFSHVLGQDLRKLLEKSLRLLLSYSLKKHQAQALPYSIAMRLAAAAKACGSLWQEKELEREGESMLSQLVEARQTDNWHSTHHLADLLIALQMVYPSLINSPWKDLWRYISQTWHLKACCFIGPCLKEHQEKEEPETTLYDLFLGYFSGQFAQRTRISHLYHLQAALIQSSEDRLFVDPLLLDLQGHFKENKWMVKQEQTWAYTLIEKKGLLGSSLERTYSPLRFVWGDSKRTHTLVCQGGNCADIQYQLLDPNCIAFIFKLAESRLTEDIEKHREINFYFDYHSEAKIKIDEQFATTFQLGQTVTIQSGQKMISLVFELLEGEGQFLGHLIRGNRPSQLFLKGDNRFHAYDWHLFLRTIRRKEGCRLKITIQILS
jgi:hypothetical protein